jgi:hypothetical protein
MATFVFFFIHAWSGQSGSGLVPQATGALAVPVAGAEAEAGAGADAEAGAEAEAVADADAVAGAEAEADAVAGAEAEAVAGAGADADADGGAEGLSFSGQPHRTKRSTNPMDRIARECTLVLRTHAAIHRRAHRRET